MICLLSYRFPVQFDKDFFLCYRMDESDTVTEQLQIAECCTPVQRISDDGETDVLKMDSYLVGPSCFELDFNFAVILMDF